MLLAAANSWKVIEIAVIFGGLFVLASIAAVCILVYQREEKNRPIMPWGARMRVERAKAHSLVVAEQLEQDATEVKRLAISHQRTMVLRAIEEDDFDKVMQLGLPSGKRP